MKETKEVMDMVTLGLVFHQSNKQAKVTHLVGQLHKIILVQDLLIITRKEGLVSAVKEAELVKVTLNQDSLGLLIRTKKEGVDTAVTEAALVKVTSNQDSLDLLIRTRKEEVVSAVTEVELVKVTSNLDFLENIKKRLDISIMAHKYEAKGLSPLDLKAALAPVKEDSGRVNDTKKVMRTKDNWKLPEQALDSSEVVTGLDPLQVRASKDTQAALMLSLHLVEP